MEENFIMNIGVFFIEAFANVEEQLKLAKQMGFTYADNWKS